MCSLLYSITRYFFLLLALAALRSEVRAQTTPSLGEFQGGRTYILAFPDTTRNLFDPRFPPPLDDRFRIMVYSSTQNRIAFGPTGGALGYGNMKGGSFQIIEVREAPVITNSGVVTPGTYTLKADEPVVVYCYFATKFGAEAWTPIPVESWGKEYRIAARQPETVQDVMLPSWELQYREKPAPAEALIMAAYDGTNVTIRDAAGAITIKTTLQTGQAYQIQTGKGPGAIADLAGAQITSNKPIGVISGNTRAQVVERPESGFSGNSFKNALMEWLTPTEQHGTRFVYMPTADPYWPTGDPGGNINGKRKAEHIRVYGTSPGTTEISPAHATSGVPPFTVAPGEFYEDTVTTPTARYYVTDKPAQAVMNSSVVTKFIPGTVVGEKFYPSIYSVYAAPYMVEMTAREQWVNFAPFIGPGHPASMSHYINVVTDTGSRNRIVFRRGDGEARIEEAFTFNRGTIPGTDLIWGTMQFIPGTTYYLRGLDTNVRFHGFVYGTFEGMETAGPQGNVYEEYIALSYGYPLAPNRYVLPQQDASISIDTTWFCSDLTITARSVGQALVGLRSISFEGPPTNARLLPVNPAAGLTPGDLTATVRIVRIDPYKDAQAVVKVADRAGRITKIPYSFSAEQVTSTPDKVLDFGEITANKPAAGKAVTLCNTTDRPVTITEIRLSTAPSSFTVQGPPLPLVLAPGECARVDIGLPNPTAGNKVYEDSLIVITSCTPFGIKLRAETVAPCIHVDDLDFGILDLDNPGSAQGRIILLEICNYGTGHVTFADSGSGVISWLAENFTVDNQNIDRLKSASLGPNQCIKIAVGFVPTDIGTFRTVARVYANTRDCRDTSVWTATVIRSTSTAVPTTGTVGYGISAVAPNPFVSTTEIGFSLGKKGNVAVEIFDEAGRRAATLLEGVLEAGSHRVRWDAEGRPPGLYYCRVTSGGWSGSTPLTLVR